MDLEDFLRHASLVTSDDSNTQLLALPNESTVSTWRDYTSGAAVDYLDFPILQITRKDEVARAQLSLEVIPLVTFELTVKTVRAVSALGDGSNNYVIEFENNIDLNDYRKSVFGDNADTIIPHCCVVMGYSYTRAVMRSLNALANSFHGKTFIFDRIVVAEGSISGMDQIEDAGASAYK